MSYTRISLIFVATFITLAGQSCGPVGRVSPEASFSSSSNQLADDPSGGTNGSTSTEEKSYFFSQTAPQTLGAITAPKVIRWDLDAQVATGHHVPGAYFEITVNKVMASDGVTISYYLTKPTLISSNKEIEVSGVTFSFAGKAYSEGTTFSQVNTVTGINATTVLLGGTLVKQIEDGLTQYANIAVSFEHLAFKGELPMPGGGMTSGPTGPSLYTSNCAGCHGVLRSSTKPGRNALQISNAINNVGAMQFLTGKLSASDLQKIAESL